MRGWPRRRTARRSSPPASVASASARLVMARGSSSRQTSPAGCLTGIHGWAPPSTMVRVARIPTVAFAAVLGVLYLALNPPSADVAAHLYRADLVERAGLVVWDNNWYGGHNLPGYSVLFPCAGRAHRRTPGRRTERAGGDGRVRPPGRRRVRAAAPPAAASAWFAVAMTAAVVSGRLAFAFGVGHRRRRRCSPRPARRPVLAGLLGAATALRARSPALFLVARSPQRGWSAGPGCAPRRAPRGRSPSAPPPPASCSRSRSPRAAPSRSPPRASGRRSPPRGSACGSRRRRRGHCAPRIALYGVLLVAAFVVPSPLGGNAARLGALLAGPLAAGAAVEPPAATAGRARRAAGLLGALLAGPRLGQAPTSTLPLCTWLGWSCCRPRDDCRRDRPDAGALCPARLADHRRDTPLD